MTAAPRLLLIEDDEVHREIVRRMLGGRFDVSDAETGDEALGLLESGSFFCALLDNRLPDYTGIELLPILAAYELPVVMMSSLVTEQMVTQAADAGCSRVLAKDAMTADSLLGAIVASAATRPPCFMVAARATSES